MSDATGDLSRFENFIPPAVRRNAAEADRLIRGDAPPPDAERTFTTVVSDEPPPEPAAPPEPPPEQVRAEEDWRQKFLSLKGRFDSQIPELTQRAQQAEARIQSLMNEMASLRTERAAAPPTAPAGDDLAADIEAYGPDLVEAAQKWAERRMNPKIAEMQAELDRLKNTTSESRQQLTMNQLERHLDATVKDWRATNANSAFIGWLNEIDPFYGEPRSKPFYAAATAGDGQRVGAFFKAFADEHTAVSQAPSVQPTHTPQGAGSVTLESLAAPGRGGSAAPGAPPAKAQISQADIARFYSDITKGHYHGRDEARRLRDAEIMSAVTEGRVK